MKRLLFTVLVCSLIAAGCGKYEIVSESSETENTSEEIVQSSQANILQVEKNETTQPNPQPQKHPVKVKGLYISGYMAGSPAFEKILDNIQGTEINAVIIDVKNDAGEITFAMDDAATVNEIQSSKKHIKDIRTLMKELKSRGLYTIARVVAFRDPYLAEQKPEWSLKNKDGSLHRDKNGLAWVNPYKKEVWDYLVEVGTQASNVGFDEVQFDYIRFSTDDSMKNVVFDEADTKGRSKTDIITEFIDYAYEKLSAENVYVSADVFGTIIGSKVDADRVGQDYSAMACHLDYICPMIYPSHYGNGNFGIDHPDMEPYRTISGALKMSRNDLDRSEGEHQAIVRPWLQDFTAAYLKNYIPYGAKEVRDEIQAVYDAGYDEWILWNASNKYTWGALKTKEEAEEEAKQIAKSRAASQAAAAVDSSNVEKETAQSDAEESLEGKIDKETAVLDIKKNSGDDEKKETRSKPNVVIVTTGGSGK